MTAVPPVDRLGATLPKLSPKFVVAGVGNGKFEDFEHLLTERDALTLQILEAIGVVAEYIKDAKGGSGGNTSAAMVGSGQIARKKLKMERSKLKQRLLDLVKVRTTTLFT